MRRFGKAVQQHDRRTIARKRVMQLDTVDGATMARNSSMHRSVPVCGCIKNGARCTHRPAKRSARCAYPDLASLAWALVRFLVRPATTCGMAQRKRRDCGE